MAQQLLKSGNTLICIARSANPDLALEAKAAGVTLEQWQQDLSQGEQAAHQLQAWLNAQGPQAFASATLINNAGVIPRIAPLSASDAADLANALRVGLEAPMLLTAAVSAATESWACAPARCSTSPRAWAAGPWPRRPPTALPRRA